MGRRKVHVTGLAVLGALAVASLWLWPDRPAHGERTPVDILIRNGIVVPMADGGPDAIVPGAVVIQGSAIVFVGTNAEADERFEGTETIDAQGGIVMPGLVNGHTHVPMTLFRPVTGEMPVMEWLQRYIFPAEAHFVRPDFVRLGTRWGLAEFIRSGITTYADMYYWEAEIAAVTKEVGLRGVLGETLLDFPSPDSVSPDAALRYTEAFIEAWKADPLVTPAVAPHAPYTVSADLYRRAADLARRHGVPLLTHLSESQGEMNFVREHYQMTPIAWLDSLGVLGPQTVAAHVVWPTPEDMAILARTGTGVVHNPKSNLRGGNGIAPVPALLAAGVRLGLGTDGPCGSNNLDLFENMDAAGIVQKGLAGDWSVIRARDLVRMATLGGAEALRMEDRIGSLEAGKQADIIIIDVSAPHLVPTPAQTSVFSSVHQHIAYAVRAADVRTTIVAGRVLMRDRQLTTIDEAPLRTEVARTWSEVETFMRAQ